jgi:hypothetical protein
VCWRQYQTSELQWCWNCDGAAEQLLAAANILSPEKLVAKPLKFLVAMAIASAGADVTGHTPFCAGSLHLKQEGVGWLHHTSYKSGKSGKKGELLAKQQGRLGELLAKQQGEIQLLLLEQQGEMQLLLLADPSGWYNRRGHRPC